MDMTRWMANILYDKEVVTSMECESEDTFP